MGRRVTDRKTDTAGEKYDECIAAHQRVESNLSLADGRGCKHTAPKLISLYRTPKEKDDGDSI